MQAVILYLVEIEARLPPSFTTCTVLSLGQLCRHAMAWTFTAILNSALQLELQQGFGCDILGLAGSDEEGLQM